MNTKTKQIKIPGVLEIAEQSGKEILPQLFNVIGVASSNQKIMLYTDIHYTPEEATAGFYDRVPGATGIAREQWHIKVITSTDAETLEAKFTEHLARINAERRIYKNQLMKDILATKDTGLFNRNYTRFSREEALYMHDQLTK